MQSEEPVSALKLSTTDRQRLEGFYRRWQIRELDLGTRRAIEWSTTWIRRDRILGEARLVCAA